MQIKHITKYMFAMAVVVFIMTGCSAKPGDEVIARVNGEAITRNELQAKIDRLPPYYRALANQKKEKFLDEIINEKLFLKEAYKRGVDRNRDVKDLLEEAKKKIVIAKFIEDEISKNAKISGKEIEDYYKLHKKEFVTPERYRVSHILVSTEPEAKNAAERLKNKEDFATVAKEVSIDTSKANGGDLGYFTEGQMIPDFEAACFKLDVGQTSPAVKTQFGYHIIKLIDKKPSQSMTLSEVSEQIKLRLLNEKKREKLEDIIKNLRQKASIEVYEK